jgi:protein-L-isoaspartate(D-aspartate) O-methyltransferase
VEQITADDITTRVDRLADDLQAKGELSDSRWREALHAVPRHLFVPSAGWATPDCLGGAGRRIDADRYPLAWWDMVYSDASIVTQADDGATDPASGQGIASSSVSAPGVVVQFLQLLDVRDGDHVLEIGTGSGWTCALVSHVVGDRTVTSIEVDPEVAAQAARNIEAAGYAPALVVGDGAQGHPGRALYDRVHVSCAVTDIPAAWIAQTRPGGLIVAPWTPAGTMGHRLRLTVVDPHTAVGSFHGPAGYMMLRAQRLNARWTPHHAHRAAITTTRLDPRAIANAGLGAHLAITAQAPGIGWHTTADETGAISLLLYETTSSDDSWAACDHEPDTDEFRVTQYGRRRLWDETADAFLRWCSWGRPQQHRFGLTLTDGTGPRLWIDSPDRPVTPKS